jgi:predicted nucleotide-binding protein (sugar kinase/HSP70/actin superfamily)
VDQEPFPALLLPVKRPEKAVRAAREFIGTDDVGGHGVQTVGNAILSAKAGFDGIIQIYPFTCMPEIIAQCALTKFKKKYKVPVMTLILDEMTGEAGYMTRLEAFVDMLRIKREQKKEAPEAPARPDRTGFGRNKRYGVRR